MFSWNTSHLILSFHDTSSLYSSKCRRHEFQQLVARLAEAISKKSTLLHYDTDCIWIRDWLPINLDDRLVMFQVATDYMDHNEARQVHKNQKLVRSRFPFLPQKPIISSNIILDGGNVVMDSRNAIISTKVVRDNPVTSEDQLIGQLTDLLSREIILVKTEGGDPTGHTDGQFQFLADGILLMNDLRKESPDICRSNVRKLNKVGVEVIFLPYKPKDKIVCGWPVMDGNYINFVATNNEIILATYGDQVTEQNVLKIVTQSDPLQRPCSFMNTSVLDQLGGGLHCITWNF